MTTTTFNEQLGLAADVLVVDADTHRTEPRDLWTSRAPSRYADRVPRVEEVDGRWVLEMVEMKSPKPRVLSMKARLRT